MKKITAGLLLILLCISVLAQQKKIDSIKKVIAAAKDDTNKVMSIFYLGSKYVRSKPDSAVILGDQALQLAKNIHYKKGEARALTLLGSAFAATGNYPKALANYFSAIKATEYTGDHVQELRILSNISNIYSFEGDDRKSLSYALQIVGPARKSGNTRMIFVSLANIGDSYEKLNILDSALFYTKEGFKAAQKINPYDPGAIGISLNNLGNVFSKLHQYDSALYYYRRGIPLLKQVNDNDAQSEASLGMAKVFRQLGLRDSSLHYGRKAIISGWNGGITARVLDASLFLTAYFKQNGQIDSAFRYQEVLLAAKDSLYSQEKTREVQDLLFSERQRQQEVLEQKAANRAMIRYYLLIAVIVFLIIMAIVFWRNSKHRQKANELLKSQNLEIEKQKRNAENALSELKTTQNQLVQSAKMASLGELTAGIAHEIQNPLNFVNNFSDVNREMISELKNELKNGNMDEALSIADDLEQNEVKISHHGKRADFIVKGMMEHSRNGTGERQATNINVLADEFLKLSYHGLRAKDKSFNAELVVHFDDKLPKMNVVQQDIGRVLINLFGNAFYAVKQKAKSAGPDYKPTVEVSTAKENGAILIKVKDNGTGIPKNIRDKIMQPFFTTKPTGEGTGLGLSLSYDIVVKGHGGKVDVDTKENEFTEFTVSLPI